MSIEKRSLIFSFENVESNKIDSKTRAHFGDFRKSKLLEKIEESPSPALPKPINPKCNYYLDVDRLANSLLDGIITEAEEKANDLIEKEEKPFYHGFYDLSLSEINKNEEKISPSISPSESTQSTLSGEQSEVVFGSSISIRPIEWPTISEFDISLGIEKIEEYLLCWDCYYENWKFIVNFLRSEENEFEYYYYYEAIFSLPSCPYPIPQATATIFFTIGRSKMKPADCEVDVCYWFEGNQFRHRVGDCELQERWLLDILDMKIKFFKSLKF